MTAYLARTAIALAPLLALSSDASAAQAFDAQAFQRAHAVGKTTLIHVGPSWCATCNRKRRRNRYG